MSTKPASIAQLLDSSGSMGSPSPDGTNTNLQLLQTDVNTFITIMQNAGSQASQLGQVGLVKFSTSASTLYALTSLDPGGSVQQAAINAVNSLHPENLTNIKEAISQGHSMLADVNAGTYNRAMILFSDGIWNTGGDPTQNLPTDIPIYTIGYGTSSSLSYLQTIADQTGGEYNVTGNPGVLVTYYNDIVGQTDVAAVMANQARDVTSYDIFPTQAEVSQGSAFGIFNAAWADASLEYTATTPGEGQIQVVLTDPNGSVVTPDVVDAPSGGGYAVLTVSDPTPGTWTVTLHPSSLPTSTVGSALGAFGPPGGASVELESHGTSSPLHVRAKVSEEGEPLEGLSVSAHSKHPLHRHDELLDRHGVEVRRILDENDFHEDQDEEAAALRILHRERPDLGLFRLRHHPASARAVGNGEYDVAVQGHKKGVGNTVYVVVRGHSPVSGTTFQRTRLLTVIP